MQLKISDANLACGGFSSTLSIRTISKPYASPAMGKFKGTTMISNMINKGAKKSNFFVQIPSSKILGNRRPFVPKKSLDPPDVGALLHMMYVPYCSRYPGDRNFYYALTIGIRNIRTSAKNFGLFGIYLIPLEREPTACILLSCAVAVINEINADDPSKPEKRNLLSSSHLVTKEPLTRIAHNSRILVCVEETTFFDNTMCQQIPHLETLAKESRHSSLLQHKLKMTKKTITLENGAPVVYSYKLVQLDADETAAALLNKLVETWNKEPDGFTQHLKKNLRGYASDGAAVMMGKKGGL
uniref:Uncharacterized protein n=1 Tax=Romanomermis culicivorax TaxID=13658 RepID=A0A915L8G7_ROMCU